MGLFDFQMEYQHQSGSNGKEQRQTMAEIEKESPIAKCTEIMINQQAKYGEYIQFKQLMVVFVEQFIIVNRVSINEERIDDKEHRLKEIEKQNKTFPNESADVSRFIFLVNEGAIISKQKNISKEQIQFRISPLNQNNVEIQHNI